MVGQNCFFSGIISKMISVSWCVVLHCAKALQREWFICRPHLTLTMQWHQSGCNQLRQRAGGETHSAAMAHLSLGPWLGGVGHLQTETWGHHAPHSYQHTLTHARAACSERAAKPGPVQISCARQSGPSLSKIICRHCCKPYYQSVQPLFRIVWDP